MKYYLEITWQNFTAKSREIDLIHQLHLALPQGCFLLTDVSVLEFIDMASILLNVLGT